MNEMELRTWPLPRVLWIELTSRCPFDCVFCSRKALRGAGEHLDFALYQRLIAELDAPQIIRLNYAGESGHYPPLAEAVALAAGTGATVELVSALASLKAERLQAALDAGLSRLTVSLHTLDPQRFGEIYRFGTLEAMQARLQQVLDWRARTTRPFVLDLAFVAMHENLHELPALAAYAATLGIEVLAVHPLIGRDPLPMSTEREHVNGRLRPSFREALARTLAEARSRAPGVQIQLSSHELSALPPLAAHPQPWPAALPPRARIGGCDQSPFDSVHVLADGRVIVCEVTEKVALGDLKRESLRAIWHGPAYRAFRLRHLEGLEAACRSCVYKTAYLPAPPQPRLQGAQAAAEQLLRGWHADDGSGVRWSGAQAAFWLPAPARPRELLLEGVLAQAPPTAVFEVHIDGRRVHRQAHRSGDIRLRLPLPELARERVTVELSCTPASSPQALGVGNDVRELGFALVSAELR